MPLGAAGPLNWGVDYWNCTLKLDFGTLRQWAKRKKFILLTYGGEFK